LTEETNKVWRTSLLVLLSQKIRT